MKVLTLTQPWATLVAIGAKRIETRSWATAYRGPLAIHAAKGFPKWAMETCYSEPIQGALRKAGISFATDLPRGVIIATCQLTDCKLIREPNSLCPEGLRDRVIEPPAEPELSFGDYAPGRFAWILGPPVPLVNPIPIKGALGLWEWQP